MSNPTDHPFQPGVRVAIRDSGGWSNYSTWKAAFVDKVYKTGHFTLKGSPQRYRAQDAKTFSDDELRWEAVSTARDRYSQNMLFVWDERTEKEVAGDHAQEKIARQLRVIKDRIAELRIGDVTSEMLTSIEAALPPVEAKP